MNANRSSKAAPESNTQLRMEKNISRALEALVRVLGLVNGTITIHARGGQLCRGLEIVNKVDVMSID
jgi:hypothetical protein